jgi:uncharacterized membrane protein YdjX (TVP38/TMEM64 family)
MAKVKKRRKLHKKTIAVIVASVVVAAILVALAIIFGDDIFEWFHKADGIKELIRSAGAFGPLIFVLLQIAQVVLAPIPGQVVAVAGGYLFGWWGLLLSMIGASIGYYIVIKLARRFGRPLAEKMFKKESLRKFDYVTESKGGLLLFLVFILPLFPDDMVCYLAGLTKAPMKSLMLAAVAGRLPSFLAFNLAGSGLESNNMSLIIIMTVGTLFALAIGYWQRDWLDRFIKSHDHIQFFKDNWKLGPAQTIAIIVAIAAVFVIACLFAFSEF